MTTPDPAALFAALGVELPEHGAANRQVRCFANPGAHRDGDRSPSTSVNIDNGAWNCFTCGAHGGAYDAAIALGHSPRDASDLCKAHGLWKGEDERPARHQPSAQRTAATQTRTPPRSAAPLPTEEAIEVWARVLQGSPVHLGAARQHRGWTPGALAVLGIGWDGRRFTIPVRDGDGQLVNLIRYLPDGKPKTLALTGRRRDLFPAPERLRVDGPELFAGDRGPEVFIVEGEADAITGQSLSPSQYAIGVPGAQGWRPEWGHRFAGMRVRVLCDYDDAGRRLTQAVARDVAPHAIEVRVLDWQAVTRRADLPRGFDLTDWALSVRDADAQGVS